MISWSQRYDKLIIYEILHGGIFISFDKCIFFLNKINVLSRSYSFHSFLSIRQLRMFNFFLSLYPNNLCAHFRIGYPIHPLLNKGFENGIVNRIVYLVKNRSDIQIKRPHKKITKFFMALFDFSINV